MSAHSEPFEPLERSEALELLERLERTDPGDLIANNFFSNLFTIRQDAIASEPDDVIFNIDTQLCNGFSKAVMARKR